MRELSQNDEAFILGGKIMLKQLFIFRDFRLFQFVFQKIPSGDVKKIVIRRGWYQFNMMAIVYVAGFIMFNSLHMQEITFLLGIGFLFVSILIFLNTIRNIKFSEQLHD